MIDDQTERLNRRKDFFSGDIVLWYKDRGTRTWSVLAATHPSHKEPVFIMRGLDQIHSVESSELALLRREKYPDDDSSTAP